MKSVRSIASIIAVIAVLVCSQNQPAGAQGNAQIIEYWECSDSLKFGSNPPVLVKLTRLRTENLEFGKVEVSGITRKAVFRIQGINRRWEFGNSNSAPMHYAFIIQPNNRGVYYDFTATGVERIQFFKCKMKP